MFQHEVTVSDALFWNAPHWTLQAVHPSLSHSLSSYFFHWCFVWGGLFWIHFKLIHLSLILSQTLYKVNVFTVAFPRWSVGRLRWMIWPKHSLRTVRGPLQSAVSGKKGNPLAWDDAEKGKRLLSFSWLIDTDIRQRGISIRFTGSFSGACILLFAQNKIEQSCYQQHTS